jgi:hypothetical protein
VALTRARPAVGRRAELQVEKNGNEEMKSVLRIRIRSGTTPVEFELAQKEQSKKRTRRRQPGHTARQRAWVQSARWKAERKAGAAKSRASRRSQPRCGANRKNGGGPCRMLALANGRCRFHGGATPAGRAWHRVQYPDPILEPEKYAKKVREIERRRQQRRERVARMKPEERAKYEARSKAAQPGTIAERENRRRSREAAGLLARGAVPAAPDPEIIALEKELADVKARRAQLQALLTDLTEGQDQ